MSLIDSLKWRSAINVYDQTKEVSQADIEKLVEAANLAPTSGGLQPFKLIVIKNRELRTKLVPVSFGQEKIAEASHLFAWAVDTDLSDRTVDLYLKRMAERRNLDVESLGQLGQSLKGYVSSMESPVRLHWAAKQAYISLGTTVSAAADLKIDMGPMEGFDPAQYQDILGLEDKNLLPVVIASVGYRSDEDVFSKLPKVRKSRADFVLDFD